MTFGGLYVGAAFGAAAMWCTVGTALGGIGGTSHGRLSHFRAALFALYGESLMKYTGVHESDSTAHD